MLKTPYIFAAIIAFGVLSISFPLYAQVPTAQEIANNYRDFVKHVEDQLVNARVEEITRSWADYENAYSDCLNVYTWSGNKWRNEQPGSNSLYIFDGKYYYNKRGSNTYQKYRTDNPNFGRRLQYLRLFTWLNLYADMLADTEQVTITEVLPESSTEKVKLRIDLPSKAKDGNLRLTTSAEPPYLLLSIIAWKDEDPEQTFICTFSDYRTLDNGIIMPFKIESTNHADRSKVDTTMIAKFEYNIDVDDALFQPPSDAVIKLENDKSLEAAKQLYQGVTGILTFQE